MYKYLIFLVFKKISRPKIIQGNKAKPKISGFSTIRIAIETGKKLNALKHKKIVLESTF